MRSILGGAFFLVLIPLLVVPTFGQARNRGRSDAERREDQRVQNAQLHLNVAEKQNSDSAQRLKSANQTALSAEKSLNTARLAVRTEQEEAEIRLGEKSGLAKSLAELKVARTRFEGFATPLREKVRATESWQQANEAAIEAKAEQLGLFEGISDSGQRSLEIQKLDAVVNKPLDLENAAIQANVEAKAAELLVERILDQIKEIRARYPNAMVEQDPQLKKARASFAAGEKKLNDALRAVQTAKAKVSKDQLAVAQAKVQLQNAKAADLRNGR